MTLTFQDEVFPTQKTLLGRVQRLRDGYSNGEKIRGADSKFVLALFKANPEYRAKLGRRRLSHFEVRVFTYQTRGFFAIFSDGTFVDFSFKKSIKRLFGDQTRARRAPKEIRYPIL